MTWRYVLYDIWTSLKQHFDDADISLEQVKYWVALAANRLLMQHIDKRDSGAFKTRYTHVPIQTEAVTGYKFVELPKEIIDFNYDGGVDYMSYIAEFADCHPPFTDVVFTRTSAAASKVLYYSEDDRPIPSNPYFYRIGSKLYILGLECINVDYVELCVYQTIDPATCDFDESMPFPDELLAVLQRYVLDLGRFALAMPPAVGVNDGTGGRIDVPMNKLISVATNPVSGETDQRAANNERRYEQQQEAI